MTTWLHRIRVHDYRITSHISTWPHDYISLEYMATWLHLTWVHDHTWLHLTCVHDHIIASQLITWPCHDPTISMQIRSYLPDVTTTSLLWALCQISWSLQSCVFWTEKWFDVMRSPLHYWRYIDLMPLIYKINPFVIRLKDCFWLQEINTRKNKNIKHMF